MALVAAWLVSGVTALPISPAENNTLSYRCPHAENCRTIPGIVYSCLATIFACTWVAVHPNVPSPKAKWLHAVLLRVAVTVCALLVPEYVVAWSIRQWLVATHIGREVAKQAQVDERSRRDSGKSHPCGGARSTKTLSRLPASRRAQDHFYEGSQ